MTKREQFEHHKKTFLQVRDYFLSTGEDFALAKAYKKPWKWSRSRHAAKLIV